MEYNSGSNRASNFTSAERYALGRFEITSAITPELYDTKFYYQLIVSIKNRDWEFFENLFCVKKKIIGLFIRLYTPPEKQQERIHFSVLDWRANGVGIQLQVSILNNFKLDTCNWIPTWSRADYARNNGAQNQSIYL